MCGIIGIINPRVKEYLKSDSMKDAQSAWSAYEAYRGLLTLQHRGQDAAGLLSYDFESKKFYQEKNLGLVAQVFNQANLTKLLGEMAIGHTRYATTGTDEITDLQPLVTGFPLGVGMAHNGNILNYHALVRELNESYKLQFLTSNDLELLLQFWCHALMEGSHVSHRSFNFERGLKATSKVMETVKGGYAVVGMVADEGLFGMRDPQGLRPLVLGMREGEAGNLEYCLASETIALQFLGFERVRDILPGEFIFISKLGEVHSGIASTSKQKATPCMFEWVYFAGAESMLEGRSVYSSRLSLGTILGDKIKKLMDDKSINPDIVCPVPDTSRSAAIALAESLGLPYREGLIKNRYIQRSFILDGQNKREKAVELKLAPVPSEIKDKNILLVDDSIVRGTTSKQIIQLLKRYGAKEVTLAVTCPPLRRPCFYGIDFPSSSELIAEGKNAGEIATWTQANRVIFLDEADMYKAINLDSLCMACVTGKYPTDVKESIEFAKHRQEYLSTKNLQLEKSNEST